MTQKNPYIYPLTIAENLWLSYICRRCKKKNFKTLQTCEKKTVDLRFQKQSSKGVLKKGVLRNFTKFTGKHLCQSLFFNKVAGSACNSIKKETLPQVFFCEFYEISKNTFLQNTSGRLLPTFLVSMTLKMNWLSNIT